MILLICFAGKQVDWVRDLWANHKVLVIKLTSRYLCNLLHKLRNPQKHDAVNDDVHRLLDAYSRLYLSGQGLPMPECGRERKKTYK